MHLHYTGRMKTATIPAVRVEPELRERVEQVLGPDESLSSFVEVAVRETVQRRIEQGEFVRRGLASLEAARGGTGIVSAEQVLGKLQVRLDQARSKRRKPAAVRK
jgi:predicted transcriptional regulator